MEESGYRYYGPAQVDRLQDILYYRALGVPLDRIRDCLDRQLKEKLGEAVAAGLSPDSEAGKAVYDLHRRWLEKTVIPLTPEKHKGIAQLYLLDERFTAYYDQTLPGCAEFLRNAADRWAK